MAFVTYMGRLGRRMLIRVLKLFLWSPSLPFKAFDAASIRRVLVVRRGGEAGDPLPIVPLLQAAAGTFPEAGLAVLTDGAFSDLLVGLPGLNEVFFLEHVPLIRHPLRFCGFLKRLRRVAFDLAIDAGSAHSDSAFLTYASKAPFRAGYRYGESDLFLNILVPDPDPNCHEIDVSLDLLRHLVGEVPEPLMRVPIPEEDRTFAAKYLAIQYVEQDDLVVGMDPSGGAEQGWPPGRFQELAERLTASYGAKIPVFGGGEVSASSTEGLVPIEPTSPRRTAALIEQCHCFVTGHTGLMHLAVAVGTPTIAIFRTDAYLRYGPQGQQHRIVYSRDGDVKLDTVLRVFRELMAWMVEEDEEQEA